MAVLLVSAPGLSWSAPPTCASGPEVEARVEALLGHPISKGRSVTVRVTEASGLLSAEIAIEDYSRRRVKADSCSALVDAVAVILALALEPLPEAKERPQNPDPDPEPNPEPPPKKPIRKLVPVAAPTEGSVLLSTFVSVEAASGLVPNWTGGGRLGVELEARPLRFELGAAAYLPQGVGQEVSEVGLWTAMVGASLVLLQVQPVSFSIRVRSHLGRLSASGGAVERAATQRAWFFAGSGSGVARWRFASWASLELSLGVLVPITRPEVVLSDGRVLFRPTVGFSGQLGLVFPLPI